MRIENTPRTMTVQPEQNAPALVWKIGKTTYKAVSYTHLRAHET